MNRRGTLALLTAALMAGCTTAAPDPPPGTPATPAASPASPDSTATPTAAPSGGPGQQGTPASTSAPGTAVAPSAPPPAPTGPAPSTAGNLTATDIAVPEGWSPAVRPGSVEEGYLGNGTWVHAVSAEHSAYAAIALGCTEVRAFPRPEAALEGTFTGPDGQRGVGVTLQFADDAGATAFFAEWVRQGEACLSSSTELITLTGDTWLGRRTLDTTWSEAVGRRGSQVRLVIVDAAEADLSTLW